MRGVNAYNSLFTAGENERKKENKKCSKGRSIDLLKKRNECIYGRFYYYSKLHKKRYEEVINLLRNEFFLTENRIVVLIQSAPTEALRAFDSWDIKDFEKKYKFLNWKIN